MHIVSFFGLLARRTFATISSVSYDAHGCFKSTERAPWGAVVAVRSSHVVYRRQVLYTSGPGARDGMG